VSRLAAISGAAAWLALAGAASAQTNLITNGTFANPTYNGSYVNGAGCEPGTNCAISGWTSHGYNFEYLNPAASGDSSDSSADWGAYASSSAYVGLYDATTGASTVTATGTINPGHGTNATNWNGNGPSNGAGGYYNYVGMDGDYNSGAMATTVTGLTAGTVYAVTFYYAFAQQNTFTGGTYQNMAVSWGTSYGNYTKTQYAITSSTPGATLMSSSNGSNSSFYGLYGYSLCSECFGGWNQITMYFEATGSSETLAFLALGNVQEPPFALLADVSMYAAPEPSSLMLMGLGSLGLAGYRRRRQRRTV